MLGDDHEYAYKDLASDLAHDQHDAEHSPVSRGMSEAGSRPARRRTASAVEGGGQREVQRAFEPGQVVRAGHLDHAQVARCGVCHWVSRSRWSACSSSSRSTSPISATFEASRTRVNIDSPANSPPMATPYSPPASSPSRQASTEWAQPSRWSSVYAAAISSSIQPPGAPGPRTRGRPRRRRCRPGSRSVRADWRIDRVTRSPESGSTPRGSGRPPRHVRRPAHAGDVDRHREQPSPVGGQHACRASRSAPTATRSPSPDVRGRERPRARGGFDGHEAIVAGVAAVLAVRRRFVLLHP